MDNFSLNEFINLALVFKIPILILIFMYALFALILFNKVRSLEKIVFISHLGISTVLDLIALIHLAGAISLFFITLVIL